MIEAEAGAAVPTIFEIQGEAGFRRLEAELLPQALEGLAVVALGGGAPIQPANWRMIQDRAVTVWIDTPLDAIWARLQGQGGRPLVAGLSGGEVGRLLEARRPRYSEAQHRVDGSAPPERVAEEVHRLWIA